MMKSYSGPRLRDGANWRASLLILSVFVFLGSAFLGAADSPQVTTIVAPLDLAFPLLPSITIVVNNNQTASDSQAVPAAGTQGTVGILRASAHD